MSSYRMDKIQFSSNLPNFINVKNDTCTITVSGTVAATGISFFNGTISLSSRSNFFSLYAVDSYTCNKYAVNNVGSLFFSYANVSSDQLFVYTTFVGNNLNITLYVENSGSSPVTLISQTYTFTAVEYQLPF